MAPQTRSCATGPQARHARGIGDEVTLCHLASHPFRHTPDDEKPQKAKNFAIWPAALRHRQAALGPELRGVVARCHSWRPCEADRQGRRVGPRSGRPGRRVSDPREAHGHPLGRGRPHGGTPGRHGHRGPAEAHGVQGHRRRRPGDVIDPGAGRPAAAAQHRKGEAGRRRRHAGTHGDRHRRRSSGHGHLARVFHAAALFNRELQALRQQAEHHGRLSIESSGGSSPAGAAHRWILKLITSTQLSEGSLNGPKRHVAIKKRPKLPKTMFVQLRRCFSLSPLHVRARTQKSTRVEVSGFTLKHGLSLSNMVAHGNFTAVHADFARGRVKSAGHRAHKHGRSEERCFPRTNTVVAKTMLNTVVEFNRERPSNSRA